MLGVVILAGGDARRFPNKLEREIAGEPMLVRVFRAVRSAGNVYVAATRTFPPHVDSALECPVIVDRRPGNGPLSALHTAFGAIAESRVFVVSGDLPLVHAGVARELLAHFGESDDGAAAVDAQGSLQPLCAVYDRLAFLQAANDTLAGRLFSVKAALERLRIRRVRLQDDRVLAGVNTPEDFVALRTFDLGLHSRA